MLVVPTFTGYHANVSGSGVADQIVSWLEGEAEIAGPASVFPPGVPVGGERGQAGSDVSDPRASRRDLPRLKQAALDAAACERCQLAKGRHRSVFSRGSTLTDLVFVGEGPGYYEDQQGLPFVGKAGKLLDKMIGAMGYDVDDVYICNVVKCRPPENRTPRPEEALACLPFLETQLEVVDPRVIVALGRCASEHLGVVAPGQKGWRGKWGKWRDIPVMPTYHPAFLLRSPQFKRQTWDDLKAVIAQLGA